MTVATNGNATGQGAGLGLTTAQISAGATGVIASDAAGNAYKQDGTAFSGGGGSIPTTTAILKGNNAGGAAAATADTDYAAALPHTTGVLKGNNAGNAVAATADTDYAAALPHTTAVLKGNNAGNAVAATAGTDYAAPMPTTTALLKGDNAGGAVAAVSGTDYLPPILLQCGAAIGIAPGGSAVGANGAAFTAGTAFLDVFGPTGNYDGVWLYFSAGAIDAAQTAGFYWVVMTSTTAGTVYQNTYVPGSTSFNPPGSNTAWTTNTGNASTTGVTTIQTAMVATIPAGFLGANGAVKYRVTEHNNNSAGAKNVYIQFGPTANAFSVLGLTTTVQASTEYYFYNRADAAKQSFGPLTSTGTSGISSNLAVNTANATTVGLQMKLATATDWVVIVFGSIEAVHAS